MLPLKKIEKKQRYQRNTCSLVCFLGSESLSIGIWKLLKIPLVLCIHIRELSGLSPVPKDGYDSIYIQVCFGSKGAIEMALFRQRLLESWLFFLCSLYCVHILPDVPSSLGCVKKPPATTVFSCSIFGHF